MRSADAMVFLLALAMATSGASPLKVAMPERSGDGLEELLLLGEVELEDGAQPIEEPAQLAPLGGIRPLLGQVRHPPLVEPPEVGDLPVGAAHAAQWILSPQQRGQGGIELGVIAALV